MRVLGLTLTACLVLSLSACSGKSDTKKGKTSGEKPNAGKPAGEKSNAEKIVGTWEIEKAEEGLGAGTVVEFTKADKMKVTAKDPKGKEIKMEGTYKVEGDKLTITMKGPDGKEHPETETITTLTDAKLVTKNAKGKTSEFKKK